MVLNKKYLAIYFSLFLVCLSYAQEVKPVEKDTMRIQKLEEVVVTGQINPQSIDKSVFEVKVIDRREIERRAGVNLADLLNQTLNLNVVPNLGNGRSSFSLFGLNGEYVKILVDNVPLINEQGFGNGADLTLINLDDIERIEILEGSMGVQYGSNAVAGVINIITKKASRHDTQISLYLQEETVGDEYELFDKGRHIQSFNAKHYFNENLFASLGALRNDFAGFYDDRLGESHDDNDERRGHLWLPKSQINPNVLINYTKDKDFTIYYKLDYFNEIINNYNNTVNLNFNSPTDTENPTAQDAEFTANRFVHTLNAMGKINKKLGYNVVASYQTQRNDVERYTYIIREDRKTNAEKKEYLSRDAFFTRATLGNLFKTDRFNLQAGYEMSLEKGFADGSSVGIIEAGETRKRRLNNYDAFLSSEYQFTDSFSIKPGVRAAFTNLFGPQFIMSLSSSFKFGNNYELKTVIGSANKTPTFDELYYTFIDSNHNFTGNPNLDPEKGYSIFAHLKKKFEFNNGARLNSKITFSYLDLKDKIESVNISVTPAVSTFLNIDDFKSVNFNFENELKYKRLSSSLGLSLQGISQALNAETGSNDDFLLNFSTNLNVNYNIPKWNTNITFYYKYRGRVQQYLSEVNDAGESDFVIGETEGFSWMDLNLQKSFYDKQFVVTLGARNILDVDFINTNSIGNGAHSEAPRSLPMAYGRSYFLKLNYNLNL
jgi:outer membrane receptor for ferrienterochelin and colicins